jgi:hypothetical protein
VRFFDFLIDFLKGCEYYLSMKIKNVKVKEYIEILDGSIDEVKLKKDLGGGYGLYVREDGREFLIFGFEKRDEEFIYVVV